MSRRGSSTEALEKLNRRANETPAEKAGAHFGTVTVQ